MNWHRLPEWFRVVRSCYERCHRLQKMSALAKRLLSDMRAASTSCASKPAWWNDFSMARTRIAPKRLSGRSRILVQNLKFN